MMLRGVRVKVKTDFITNSSSTAYIVFIPKNFTITDSDIEDAFIKAHGHWQEEHAPNLVDNVKGAIEDVKRGSVCHQYDEMYEFYTLLQICRENDFILQDFDLPSDCGFITGISSQMMTNCLAKEADISELIVCMEKDENKE